LFQNALEVHRCKVTLGKMPHCRTNEAYDRSTSACNYSQRRLHKQWHDHFTAAVFLIITKKPCDPGNRFSVTNQHVSVQQIHRLCCEYYLMTITYGFIM